MGLILHSHTLYLFITAESNNISKLQKEGNFKVSIEEIIKSAKYEYILDRKK